MSDNFLEIALKELGSAGIGALGKSLGLDEGQGQSAVTTGMASVLAGMLNKGSSKTGLASLFNMITKSDDLDFSSIGDLFGDATRMGNLQTQGGTILDSLFGPKAGGVGNVVASALGLGGDKGGSLLKTVAPIVMTLFNRLVKAKGLDMSGLAKALFGQRQFLKGILPDGLLSTMGVHDFEDLGQHLETHGHNEPQSVRETAPKRGGFAKWFWPLLIALAVLYALSMCAQRDQETTDIIIEETPATPEVVEPIPPVPEETDKPEEPQPETPNF